MACPRVACLLLVLMVWRASAQLNCRTLNVERSVSEPLSGSTLDTCQTSSSQCCSQTYLSAAKMELGEELLEDLKKEVLGNVDIVINARDMLSSYLEVEFLAAVRSGLPLASRFSEHIAEATVILANLLNRTRFAISDSNPEVNMTKIVIGMIDGLETIVQNTDSIPQSARTCINNGIPGLVNYRVVTQQGKDLEQVRRAYTLLIRISNFLSDFAKNFRGFVVSNIPKTCMERAVEVSFCGRCQAVLPPICSNTCRALVRGCYAPFVTSLRGQFNRLWNVTRQTVNVLKVGVTKITAEVTSLIEATPLQDLIARCLTAGSVGKRSVPSNFPARVETIIRSINGLLLYGTSGPRFCRPENAELRYCNGSDSAPSNRRCSSEEVCTSPCKCWNGTSMQNNDTIAFTGDLVDEQGKNPVVKIPKEESEAIVTNIGTPVDSFLTSMELATIFPQNVTVPKASKGTTLAVISMSALIGALLVQMFVV